MSGRYPSASDRDEDEDEDYMTHDDASEGDIVNQSVESVEDDEGEGEMTIDVDNLLELISEGASTVEADGTHENENDAGENVDFRCTCGRPMSGPSYAWSLTAFRYSSDALTFYVMV
jgi:hypothetical protein